MRITKGFLIVLNAKSDNGAMAGTPAHAQTDVVFGKGQPVSALPPLMFFTRIEDAEAYLDKDISKSHLCIVEATMTWAEP